MAGMSRKPALALAALITALTMSIAGHGAGASGAILAVSRDTEWSGRIVLDRTVVVQKGSTLTILPGTRIEFLSRDEDKDGIGDTALRIEGRIMARGTTDEPIVFTSGKSDPEPADWMFVILEFSKDSRFEYCRFSYAYSGLQVHYSTAVVSDCIFKDNVDGFRFSTANVSVENCLMKDNVNGIRYEERKSRTRIRRNIISGNEIGIFCVTGSDDRTLFSDNNIHGNRLYDFKMGLLQKKDVHLPGNWWGTTDEAVVAKRIFDGLDDPALGRVFVNPVLEFEVSAAGPHIE